MTGEALSLSPGGSGPPPHPAHKAKTQLSDRLAPAQCHSPLVLTVVSPSLRTRPATRACRFSWPPHCPLPYETTAQCQQEARFLRLYNYISRSRSDTSVHRTGARCCSISERPHLVLFPLSQEGRTPIDSDNCPYIAPSHLGLQ